jgi:D-sedoheptulose 7-phosphate isomerase
MHLEAELAGKFEGFESCLPCICLGLNLCYVTAVTNDFGWDQVFARQIRSLAKSGDVLVGLTVSGHGDYYQKAISEAQLQGCFIVQIAGPDCWHPAERALVIRLGKDTPSLQEEQLQCIHRLCRRVKMRFNGHRVR